MTMAQPGILAPLPAHSRYICLNIRPGTDAEKLKQLLQQIQPNESCLVALGRSLVSALNAELQPLRPFPSYSVNVIEIPATPYALWIWLRGSDRGDLLHAGRRIYQQLESGFELADSVEGFTHGSGRDLTGYEDGTENPEGEAAIQAALCNQTGLEGSSFVAVQQWQHNFDRFEALTQVQQDHSIGRRLNDNKELDEAPESAHVKRTAQESFNPEAFLLRRSMPWSEAEKSGLMFVAFANSFNPFEAQLERMIGLEDGITDALFQFTQPISGSYFWCPALSQGKLDLTPLGL
ncbi:MAG: Dyp-type peroxidase [Motiliproteus sp.]